MLKWLRDKYYAFIIKHSETLNAMGEKAKITIETKDERLAEAKALIREGLGLKPKK